MLPISEQQALFQQFVSGLPTFKTVTLVTCCPKCSTEVARSPVKVNGLNDWAYKNTPDGGFQYERGSGGLCPNKCFS